MTYLLSLSSEMSKLELDLLSKKRAAGRSLKRREFRTYEELEKAAFEAALVSLRLKSLHREFHEKAVDVIAA